MNDSNENQAIKIAVGVLITIALVGMVITLFMKSVPFMESAGKKVDVIGEQMEAVNYKNFDGSEVAGSEVISAINTKANSDVTVKVVTLAGGTVSYNRANYNVASPSDKNYIEPAGKFSAVLERNANKSVIGITFTQLNK